MSIVKLSSAEVAQSNYTWENASLDFQYTPHTDESPRCERHQAVCQLTGPMQANCVYRHVLYRAWPAAQNSSWLGNFRATMEEYDMAKQ